MFNYINKVIGVFNQKGGVGKTTVAAIAAEFLALKKGLRVLVIDTDMQCNTSEYWVGMEPAPDEAGGLLPPKHPEYDGSPDIEERSTIADIYYGKEVVPYSTYLDGESHGTGLVDVILGHPSELEKINNNFERPSGEIPAPAIAMLGAFLHNPFIHELYDVIVIDTGPSRSPLFRGALRASTHALIPFEPELKSLQGINAMLQAIAAENYSRSGNVPLETLGLIPNKVRHTNLHTQALEAVRSNRAGRLCPENVYLPNAIAFPERDVRGANPQSVFNLRESDKARTQSEIVGEFIFERVFDQADVAEFAS